MTNLKIFVNCMAIYLMYFQNIQNWIWVYFCSIRLYIYHKNCHIKKYSAINAHSIKEAHILFSIKRWILKYELILWLMKTLKHHYTSVQQIQFVLSNSKQFKIDNFIFLYPNIEFCLRWYKLFITDIKWIVIRISRISISIHITNQKCILNMGLIIKEWGQWEICIVSYKLLFYNTVILCD